MFKALFLALLTFSAVVWAKPEPRDPFDDADALLLQYRSTIAKLEETASAEQNRTELEIRNTARAVSSIARKIIVDTHNRFMSQLLALDSLASDHGLEYFQCTYGAKRQLNQGILGIQFNIDRCVNGIIEESLEILEQALSNFQNLDDTAEEYANRIEDCRSANDGNCVLLVTSQIGLQNDMLPILLASDIQEIRNQFSDVDLIFQTCSIPDTEGFRNMGRVLVENAARCIDDMIREQGKILNYDH